MGLRANGSREGRLSKNMSQWQAQAFGELLTTDSDTEPNDSAFVSHNTGNGSSPSGGVKIVSYICACSALTS